MTRGSALVGVLFTFGILSAQDGPKLPPVSPDTVPAPKPGPELPGAKGKPLDQLKAERKALDAERDASKSELEDESATSSERRAMKKKLDELLKKMSEKPVGSAKVLPPGVDPKIDPKADPKGSEKKDAAAKEKEPVKADPKPVDALALAQALYKSGDFEGAYRAFKLIELDPLNREQRAFVQYMTASCLRKQNKLGEAAALFREVADAKDDDFLTECALWQLGTIRWRQDLEKQLSEMRAKRENLKP
jgi:tetratricopeptide (TPR) repeat protein